MTPIKIIQSITPVEGDSNSFNVDGVVMPGDTVLCIIPVNRSSIPATVLLFRYANYLFEAQASETPNFFEAALLEDAKPILTNECIVREAKQEGDTFMFVTTATDFNGEKYTVGVKLPDFAEITKKSSLNEEEKTPASTD